MFWGTPCIPRGQYAPGLSPLPVSPTEAGFRRGHTSSPAPPRPRPAARGARGERGGRRAAPRLWAAARDELSGPAGCCRQVASDAARGRRPRRGPRGAFPASRPPQAGPGLLGPGLHPGERPAPPRPPPLPSARPPARGLLTCASSPPAPRRPPLRAAPRGAARRTQASQPASQRGGATVTKPAASARSAATATGFPSSPGPRAPPPPPPPRPIGAPACGRRAHPSRRAAPPANRERPGCGRRARGGGDGRAAARRGGAGGCGGSRRPLLAPPASSAVRAGLRPRAVGDLRRERTCESWRRWGAVALRRQHLSLGGTTSCGGFLNHRSPSGFRSVLGEAPWASLAGTVPRSGPRQAPPDTRGARRILEGSAGPHGREGSCKLAGKTSRATFSQRRLKD